MSHSLKDLVLASAGVCVLVALPVSAHAQVAIGDLVSPDATVKGAVQTVATGARVMSGSSVTAGASTAGIRLARGGELRVCPRATVTVTTSPNGRDMAISMGTGCIETHYRVRASSADTIITPDFRILLAGPGNFDFAVSADARGNTCVRSLSPGASIIVSEIMGDGTYQVQSGEQVLFRNGSVAHPSPNVPPDCGCPAPIAVMNAETQPVQQNAPAPAPAPPQVPQNTEPAPAPAQPPTAEPTKVLANSPQAVFAEHGHAATPSTAMPEVGNPATPPPPDSEIHISVDAPLVFRGDDPKNIPPAPQIATLRLVYLPKEISEIQDVTVLPPPEPQKPKKDDREKVTAQKTKPASKGFFGHLKSFFGSIFK